VASTPDPPVLNEDAAGTGAGGDYTVGATLREGWGGTLREGIYVRSDRRVTVEEVRAGLVSSPGVVDRLAQLGREMASLRDPHLLAVYDLVDEGGVYRLVAEWSDAPSLASIVGRQALPASLAIAAVCDVLSGLETLHARGLFHGQVGPETVVVEADGRARLAELALCAAAAPAGFGTRTDVLDTARLGLHLLRKAGSRLDPVRRPLEAASSDPVDAARLRAELEGAATAVLGPGWREGATRPAQPRGRGRRRRGLLLLLALAGLVIAAAAVAVVLLVLRGRDTTTAAPLSVGPDASLTVSPAAGGCNTTFSFVGRGSLSGTGTLVYRWEQSDGQVTANTPLPITGSEGAFQLTQAWRLEGSQRVNATMTLHILRPVDRAISRAFQYNCQ
jgi:hypothetical protein